MGISSPLNRRGKYKQNVSFLLIQRFISAFPYVSISLDISAAFRRDEHCVETGIKKQGKHCKEGKERKNSKN